MKEQTAIIGLNSYMFSQFFRSRKSGIVTHFLLNQAKFVKGINKENLPKVTNLVYASNIKLTNLIILIDKFEDADRYTSILEQVKLYINKEVNVFIIAPKINSFEELSEVSIIESCFDAPFKLLESKLLSAIHGQVKRIYLYNYFNPLSLYSEECKQIILKANRIRQDIAWTDMKQLFDNVLAEVSVNKKKDNTVLKSKDVVTYVSQGMLLATSKVPSLDFGVCLNQVPNKLKSESKIYFDWTQTKQVLSGILDKINN